MTELSTKQNELINLLSDQIIQIEKCMNPNDELINRLFSDLMDLTMTAKIELGDAVITEIKRLREEITQLQKEQA